MSLLSHRQLSANWAEPLIQAGDSAILLAGRLNAQQIAILPFDLRDSNLPLLIAFPLLMANLLDWFSPADIISQSAGLTIGDVLTISPPLRADSIRITAPDATVYELPVAGDTLAFTQTDQLGLYQLDVIEADEVARSQAFAVNLFATGESDIRPVPAGELRLGGAGESASGEEQLGLQEFWLPLAVLALLLLMIEWWVYHRRLRAPTVLGAGRRFSWLPRWGRNS